MNLQKLKRWRGPLLAGHLFAYRLRGAPFRYGRIVRTDCEVFGSENILAYFYRTSSRELENIPELRPEDLLIPPVFTNRLPWTAGYCQVLLHRELTKEDVLAQHCFLDPLPQPGRPVDEFGRTLSRYFEPVGLYALSSYRTIDTRLSRALGIEPSPDCLPPPPGQPPRPRERRRPSA